MFSFCGTARERHEPKTSLGTEARRAEDWELRRGIAVCRGSISKQGSQLVTLHRTGVSAVMWFLAAGSSIHMREQHGSLPAATSCRVSCQGRAMSAAFATGCVLEARQAAGTWCPIPTTLGRGRRGASFSGARERMFGTRTSSLNRQRLAFAGRCFTAASATFPGSGEQARWAVEGA
ncbi:hypothetical protein BU16DRAFT_134687 [Lophium mytilinum]|uniref:Uncharacterized protein n=1 Tax=Lophium mytilinum TaxID=390894 RepID=A0A6A6QF96_9PEZI|nr:hypothetical protein BU16DRAFT_134687 [Lophium mytilinum]